MNKIYNFPERDKCYSVKVTSYTKINKLGEPDKVIRTIRDIFVWSSKAREKQRKYHETKNGKTYLKLPIKKKVKQTKIELLNSRSFSEYHYRLIDTAYSKENKSMQILRRCAEKSKHEIDIENMYYKLKAYKLKQKLRNSTYKMIIYARNNKDDVIPVINKYYNIIPDISFLSKLNDRLSKKKKEQLDYHHLVIKDRKDNTLLLLVNNGRY